MHTLTHPIHLPARDFRTLFVNLGPSLGLWRGAEIAVMREALNSLPNGHTLIIPKTGADPCHSDAFESILATAEYASGAAVLREGSVLSPSVDDCHPTDNIHSPTARAAVPLFREPVLDLGCGNGLISSYILPRAAIGLDLDGPGLEQCATRGLFERLICAPIEQAGLPDASLGTVISNSTLEHIESIDTVLEGIARVLRPGGRLIFTSPTEAFSDQLALRSKDYVARRNRHFIHINLWPLDEWSRRLERVGLQIETVRPYFRPNWVRLWDWVELSQGIYLGKTRVVGKLWKSLSPSMFDRVSRWATRLDLSSPAPGGGRLITARRVG